MSTFFLILVLVEKHTVKMKLQISGTNLGFHNLQCSNLLKFSAGSFSFLFFQILMGKSRCLMPIIIISLLFALLTVFNYLKIKKIDDQPDVTRNRYSLSSKIGMKGANINIGTNSLYYHFYIFNHGSLKLRDKYMLEHFIIIWYA